MAIDPAASKPDSRGSGVSNPPTSELPPPGDGGPRIPTTLEPAGDSSPERDGPAGSQIPFGLGGRDTLLALLGSGGAIRHREDRLVMLQEMMSDPSVEVRRAVAGELLKLGPAVMRIGGDVLRALVNETDRETVKTYIEVTRNLVNSTTQVTAALSYLLFKNDSRDDRPVDATIDDVVEAAAVALGRMKTRAGASFYALIAKADQQDDPKAVYFFRQVAITVAPGLAELLPHAEYYRGPAPVGAAQQHHGFQSGAPEAAEVPFLLERSILTFARSPGERGELAWEQVLELLPRPNRMVRGPLMNDAEWQSAVRRSPLTIAANREMVGCAIIAALFSSERSQKTAVENAHARIPPAFEEELLRGLSLFKNEVPFLAGALIDRADHAHEWIRLQTTVSALTLDIGLHSSATPSILACVESTDEITQGSALDVARAIFDVKPAALSVRERRELTRELLERSPEISDANMEAYIAALAAGDRIFAIGALLTRMEINGSSQPTRDLLGGVWQLTPPEEQLLIRAERISRALQQDVAA